MKTVILTGATGFLGSHILKTLLHNTDNNIIVLKRSFSDCWRIKDVLNNKRITFYNLDNTNLEDILWDDVDTIIHCATDMAGLATRVTKC